MRHKIIYLVDRLITLEAIIERRDYIASDTRLVKMVSVINQQCRRYLRIKYLLSLGYLVGTADVS